MATVIREERFHVGAHELICEQTYSRSTCFRKLKDSEGCCTDGQCGQLPTASSWHKCSSHQRTKRYSEHVCQTCWKTPFYKGLQRYRAHQRQKAWAKSAKFGLAARHGCLDDANQSLQQKKPFCDACCWNPRPPFLTRSSPAGFWS